VNFLLLNCVGANSLGFYEFNYVYIILKLNYIVIFC